ncbi:phage antirepressor KilAC domain-containing protein [Acinetobacter lwoffii]|uniref:phage antirepressor KilAC domain-containing protein n=1 Tax=Acinetobacter lwoffii TaxID=28090 RepID=UPI00209B4757|nr:phage antirepressor KilAC domain-containing protein [Acinetobacter lwoffii]MCO8112824.1 phage antirepressor KilAC domain-containing protein [Acinetobacter lwoffii]
MNMLTQGNFNTNEVTMSSLEIVDFINEYRAKNESNPVQLRHADFMAKAPKVLGDKGLRNFSDTYIHHQNGQTYPCFKFPKREACLMAMSYSYELQAQVFDRMTAMEEALKAKNSFDITNPAHLLQAIEVQAKLNIELSEKVAVLAPKAEALEVIADTSNTYCLRECAKTIGIKESDLIKLLIDRKWVYRDSDRKLQPHAQYVINGVFTNRTSPVITNRNDGKERVFLHMRVTAFGLTRITGLVNKMRKAQQVAA